VDSHEDLLFTHIALFNQKLAYWLVFSNVERPQHCLGQRSPSSRVGRWRSSFGPAEKRLANELLAPFILEHGYELS